MKLLDVVCPISARRVDERVTRIVALMVCAAYVAGIIFDLRWIAVAMALDFAVRGFTAWPVSYLAQLGKFIARLVGLEPKPINAGPKILAARVGFVLSSIVAISAFIDWSIVSIIAASILALFAGLEGFFGICVACRIHTILMRLYRGPFYFGHGDGI